jgi:hypothetical protein
LKHLIASDAERDYFVVIEPGVCFGGYGAEDKIRVKVTDEGRLDVTMNTICCQCSKPMSVRFFLDNGKIQSLKKCCLIILNDLRRKSYEQRRLQCCIESSP